MGELQYDAAGLIKTQMDLAGVPATLPTCVSTIDVTVGIQGDINGAGTFQGGEQTFILGEDCLTNLGVTPTGAQCGGFSFVTVSVSAQKVSKKGDLSELKGKSIQLVFDYSNIKIGKKKLSEEKYIEKKVKDANKKEEGKGDFFLCLL